MGHWLSQQQDLSPGEHDQTLKLVAAWDLIHVNTRGQMVYAGNSFSISESGAIGISCREKPSLSVMYPNTDEVPTILSHSKVYHLATFLKVSGKEYLAAACLDDGCLYLWDIEYKMARKVFDPRLPKNQNDNELNIFKINDNTAGYGEESSSSRWIQKN